MQGLLKSSASFNTILIWLKVEEIKAPTAEDLEVFRNQLRKQVEGELDIDTKKPVLNSLIKKLKVDQNGLLEIDFGVALGNTP